MGLSMTVCPMRIHDNGCGEGGKGRSADVQDEVAAKPLQAAGSQVSHDNRTRSPQRAER